MPVATPAMVYLQLCLEDPDSPLLVKLDQTLARCGCLEFRNGSEVCKRPLHRRDIHGWNCASMGDPAANHPFSGDDS